MIMTFSLIFRLVFYRARKFDNLQSPNFFIENVLW